MQRRYAWATIALNLLAGSALAEKPPMLTDTNAFRTAYGQSYFAFDLCGDAANGALYRKALAEKVEHCPFAPDAKAGFRQWAAATDADDIAGWRAADAAFHAVHYSRAPQRLHHEVIRLAERNDLYRSVWLRDAPHRDSQTAVEHERILQACRQHNVLDAVHGIARHQARIAITVLTHAVPEREPAIIRAALQLVLGFGLAG